jgi:hypothetical protein
MTNIELAGQDVNQVSGAINWCNDYCGEINWDFAYKDALSDSPIYTFRFPNEKHAIMFALKWLSK